MVTHNSSHQRLALLAFSGGIFCIQLDAFALNLALLQIGRDLEAPEGWLKWVVSGYLLSVGMFMLAAGRLSDRFGYRRLLMIGLSVFGMASMLCAVAPSMSFLVFARVLQGVGGACIMPAGLALLTNIYPAEQRGRAIGFAIGLGGVATALGPFFGGALTEWYSWRLIFWMNVPIVLFAIGCCYIARPMVIRRTESKELDVIGLFVISLALAILSFLLDGLAGHTLGATAGVAVALLFVGLMSGFVIREKNVSAPLIDVGLFRNKHYVALSVAGAIANVATVAHLFIVPLSLQAVWGLPPLYAGMAFLAPAVLMACGGPIAGRVRPAQAVSVMAWCLGISAVFFIAAASMQSLWVYVLFMTLCGGTLGVANALTLVATQAVVNPEVAGVASGVTKTLITIAAGLGVVLSGFAYQQALMNVGLCCFGAFVLLLFWRKFNKPVCVGEAEEPCR